MLANETTDQFNIDAYDEIRRLIEAAMKGSADGDVAQLRGAFHEEARMFGEVFGRRYDEPIASFFEMCEEHPLGKGNSYRSRVVSITPAGSAAMVMVAEDGCWGSASFVDFFTVTRMNGNWKITNKTFAYTGGDIPREVLGD